MTTVGYTSREVAGITGLSQRQLTYWRNTGLIVPAHSTQGGHARYSFTDLIALKTGKRLIDAGVSVQRMRSCIASLLQFLPHIQRPLGELSLVVTGDVVLAFYAGSAFEALTGQEWVLPVAELEREVAHWQMAAHGDAPVQTDLFTDDLVKVAVGSHSPPTLLEDKAKQG